MEQTFDCGVPMDEYCENVGLEWGDKQKNEIYDQVLNMGATIIKAKGKTHYGIATCVCSLADAVLNQRLTVAPVTSPLQGNTVWKMWQSVCHPSWESTE